MQGVVPTAQIIRAELVTFQWSAYVYLYEELHISYSSLEIPCQVWDQTKVRVDQL